MSALSPPSYAMAAAPRYPSDVDDPTWALIAPLLARPTARGRPRVHADRLSYDAIVDVARGGIAWRILPRSFPAWQTVCSRFRARADAGVWQKLTDTVRPELRIELGREPSPSAGAIDSQSRRSGPGVRRAAAALGLQVEIVARPQGAHGFRPLPRRWVVETTRTHYPTNASVDNQPAVRDRRGHRAAQPRGARRDQTRRRALRPRRRWSLVSAPATVAVPLRPKRVPCSVAGSASRRPIANACSGS